MGIIDNIKSRLGIGSSSQGKKPPVRKDSGIDTTDKVQVSGKKKSADDGKILPKNLSGKKVSGKARPLIKKKKPLSPEDMEKRLKDTVHRMTAIARGFGGDFKMDVKEGKDWAYHFEDNSITYPRQDLVNKTPDYAMGVILHELSHRRYSRWVVEPEMQQNEPFLFLNNAVEDPRVNNITSSRFEGARDFFKVIYDEDLFTSEFESEVKQKLIEKLKQNGLSEEDAKKAVEQMGGEVPRHIQYGLGLIYDWYTGGKMDPRIKDDQVKKALKKTASKYREAFRLKRDVLKKDLTPAEINKQAMDAYRIVKKEIWPEYQKLVEEDKKDLANSISGTGGQGKSGKGQKSGQKSGQSGQSGRPRQGQQSGQQSGQSGSASGSQQGQQEQQSGQPGGAGGGGDKKTGDKDKQSQAAGSGGKIDPEKAKEIAEKVINELDKDLSGSKFEERDQGARRNNRPGKDGKPQQGQQGQGANQGKGANQGQDASQGKGQQGQGQDGQGQKSQGKSSDSKGGGQGGQTSKIDLPSLEELLQKKMELEARNESLMSNYDSYVYDTVEYSQELAGELKNFMHEHERPRYHGNFRSGKKLNLRKAMQSEARYALTGEFDEEIWMRRTKPTKHDHQFLFVLDESGSMRGGAKWENALQGLVLCQEALDEMDIDFGVIGFSDYPQVHKSLEDKFTEDFRDNELNQINNSQSGGTNDADAIQTALEMLRIQEPDKQKSIIVITDGEGKSEEVKKLVEEAEEAGIRIIGVGIGAGTDSVERVYKHHVKVDNIAQLPMKLAGVVREQIEGAYDDEYY